MTHIVPWIRPSVLHSAALVALILFGSVVPRDGQAQAPDVQISPPVEAKDNPFSGFETHFLSNGLKVWFKRLPDAPNVSVSVGVPYGWDADPQGKEELAHLTEHVLFSDHDGRTEQEIKEAIEGLGGRRNGFTTPDHTWYYVTISKEHGGFAIEWLSRLVSPHTMDADVVERNRQPVALEINAQPRELFERVWASLNPPWLMPSDFWEREFGMNTRNAREYDRWASLQRITAQDVADFYDRYYVPEAMTLTVIGDLSPSEVLAISERTFGSLPQRPVPERDVEIEDPARRRATSYWGLGPNVRYTARYKFFDSVAEDDLMVLFVRDLLRRRLNQRLRYGEQKAVYGLQVTTTRRGSGGFLQIRGSIDENEYGFAEEVIQEEIGALRRGIVPRDEFEADRIALVEGLRGENLTAEALNFWVFREFYDSFKHADFPDILSFFEGVTQEEVASFVTSNLVREREVVSIVRVQPVGQGVLAVAALLLVFLTVRLVGWALTRDVTMRDIRYVARFRVPILLTMGWAVLFGGAGFIVARLIVFAIQTVTLTSLLAIDSYAIQMTAFGVMLIAAVALFILLLSRIPRKILVFPDHLLIKFLAFRSRILRPLDLLEVSTRRFPQVWLTKGLFRCALLTFGVIGPGIYMRTRVGRGFFFRTRHNQEIVDLLRGWHAVVYETGPAIGRQSEGLDEGQMKELLKDLYQSDAPGSH